eukprot:RCo030494
MGVTTSPQVKAAFMESQLLQLKQENETLESSLKKAHAEISELKTALHRVTQRHSALEAENEDLLAQNKHMHRMVLRLTADLQISQQNAIETASDLSMARSRMDDIQEEVRWFG